MPSAPLPHRAILRLGGEDRRAFLQGLISNDVRRCQIGQPLYAALLTPQGKFLHDMFLVDSGDAFLLDVEADRRDDLRQRLEHHKLRSRVVIEDQRDVFALYAFWDEDAPPTVPDGFVFQDPRLPELGWRVIAPRFPLQNAGAYAAYDRHRLALGVADGSRDMVVGQSTLLEGNFDLLHGISWDKGCYMGQELTARTHYRGLVKKRLFPVSITGETPEEGTPIFLDGAEIGTMRSACGQNGLALLATAQVAEGIGQHCPLSCNTALLTPSRPFWSKTPV